MTFLVRVLRRAERDVEGILHFIAEVRKAPEGALRWYRAYEAALDRLAKEAGTLPLAPESEFVEYDVRQTHFRTRKGKTYRMLFTIVGEEVRVLHVRGPGQDIMTALQLGGFNDD
jgi:plasmid stabilization system protein ParE